VQYVGVRNNCSGQLTPLPPPRPSIPGTSWVTYRQLNISPGSSGTIIIIIRETTTRNTDSTVATYLLNKLCIILYLQYSVYLYTVHCRRLSPKPTVPNAEQNRETSTKVAKNVGIRGKAVCRNHRKPLMSNRKPYFARRGRLLVLSLTISRTCPGPIFWCISVYKTTCCLSF
jgi:hypothetical protein